MDLFDRLTPLSGECRKLGEPINSGVRYCHGQMLWRWAHERVADCRYRTAQED